MCIPECLTCPLLGDDWAAESRRQWSLPDPRAVYRHRRIAAALRGDQRTLELLTPAWQSVASIAERTGQAVGTVAQAICRLRLRQPGLVEHKRGFGYRVREIAS